MGAALPLGHGDNSANGQDAVPLTDVPRTPTGGAIQQQWYRYDPDCRQAMSLAAGLQPPWATQSQLHYWNATETPPAAGMLHPFED